MESKMMSLIEDRWLNSREASDYLGITVKNLRVKVCRGQLIPCYFGRTYRFKKNQLDSAVREKEGVLCKLKRSR